MASVILTIRVNIDADAFQDAPEQEVARILNKAAAGIADGSIEDDTPLYDINGNRCGEITTSEEEDE